MLRAIDRGVLEQVLVGDTRRFDKGGEYFYDQISRMHKSVRGSSPMPLSIGCVACWTVAVIPFI